MSFTYEDSEPVTLPPTIPKTLTSTRKVDGVRMLAGIGVKPAKIMFLATTVLEEEERDYQKLSAYDEAIKVPPEYLKGLTGSVLRNTTEALGIPVDKNYYTAWIKWLAPKGVRMRPNKEMMAAARPLVMQEIKEVDPDIIVCFGKPVFDELSDTKYRLSDIIGGWFQQEVYGRQRLLYPVECITKLATRPDRLPQFQQDMAEVSRMIKRRAGVYTDTYEKKYQVIDSAAKLEALVAFLEDTDQNLLSVDCEWHGINHKVGQLRSIQLCWAPGEAAYIRFMDDQLNYALDVSYKKAGEILGRHLNKPQVKYIGHHISADFPWMFSWLGLDWYGKAVLDTEFAQQTVEEASDLGLERMAMAYTDLGRYDLPLILWKKKNGKLCKGGYGYIPDDILIDYACRDVDTVMRAYPHIERRLKQDYEDGKSHEYYHKIFNPFVTDIFTSFCINGLPVDQDKIDTLRNLYQYARTELYVEFLRRVVRESEHLLMLELLKVDMDSAEENMDKIKELCGEEKYTEAEAFFYSVIPTAKQMEVRSIWKYFLKAPTFNPRTADDMRLLLFDVKGFTPVKSTNKKDKGLPSMPWEKVLELPEDKQKMYSPSADKQTVEILANNYSDATLHKLLEFKAVSTVCSSFLGEPDIDEDTGETVEEHGLHAFIADGNIYGMYSSTESGRPRSWRPNLLNLPGFVNKKINSGMADILSLRRKEGVLPEEFLEFEEDPKSIPSVRSIVTAPEGWCIAESDLKTAELRGWAYISGDEQMINLITRPDTNFAKVKPEKRVDDDCVCRLAFPEYLVEDTHKDNYDKYLMTYTVDGEIKATFTDEDLLRDADGNIVHASQDLHWGLAEQYQRKPREVLNKKGLRGAAKTVNFSCLDEKTLIDTDSGSVKIANILSCHKLWDGVEWVTHKGVLKQGTRYVITHDTLTATPDHVVWTDRGKMCFGDAAQEGVPLQRSSGIHSKNALSRNGSAMREGYSRIQSQLQRPRHKSGVRLRPALCKVGLASLARFRLRRVGLRQDRQQRQLQSGKPTLGYKVRKPTQPTYVSRSSHDQSTSIPRGVPLCELYKGNSAQHVPAGFDGRGHSAEIQGCRKPPSEDQEETRKIKGGCAVTVQEHAPTIQCKIRRTTVAGRFDRRRYTEKVHRYKECPGDGQPKERSPRFAGAAAYSAGVDSKGLHRRRVKGKRFGFVKPSRVCRTKDREAWIANQRKLYQRIDKEGPDGRRVRKALQKAGLKPRRAKVYDILDAGPRHRFSANGKLVSNSAYGASGNTLERKIEADTGVKPTEGMGDELLATLEARQPRAFEFMYEMERKPEDPGYMVAASGRTRHFHLCDKNKTDWWSYKSHVSAMGREARNFFCQESVAATAARAAVWLYRFRHIMGLQGRPIAVLYDSVVTVCPCEERRIWKKAHELFIHLANGWSYHGRVLRYPVDHELNQSWSSKPTKEQSNYIDSFDYLDTPEGIEAEKWLDTYVKFFTENEEASVYGIDWALKQLEQTKRQQQGQ